MLNVLCYILDQVVVQSFNAGDSVIKMFADNRYFLIRGSHDNVVVDAAWGNSGKVHLWKHHGESNQLWFWDWHDSKDGSAVIRSKNRPNKVLCILGREYMIGHI